MLSNNSSVASHPSASNSLSANGNVDSVSDRSMLETESDARVGRKFDDTPGTGGTAASASTYAGDTGLASDQPRANTTDIGGDRDIAKEQVQNDPVARAGVGQGAGVGKQLDADGYPPQRHAGKVGLGPNYHVGGGFTDKVRGTKEILQGKLKHDAHLVETGRLRRTGELAEIERKEKDDQEAHLFTHKQEGTVASKLTAGEDATALHQKQRETMDRVA